MSGVSRSVSAQENKGVKLIRVVHMKRKAHFWTLACWCICLASGDGGRLRALRPELWSW